MSKPSKHEILVQNILVKIGDTTNIKDVYHCATRMRLTLHNNELVKINELKTIPNLKGALWSNGELQLIIGPEVSQVTSLLKSKTKFPLEKTTITKKQTISFWSRFLKSVSAIFGPLIPFLIGVGLIMALQTLLIRTGVVHEIKEGAIFGTDYNVFDLVLNVIAQSGFKLMGVIAIWSTVRYLGGKTPIAIALGLLMISPIIPTDASGNWLTLFTIGSWNVELKPFYSTILVFIIMGIIIAYAQKTMEKHFHPVVNFVLNPFLTLLLGGLIAFFIMGPIMGVIENALINAFNWFMKLPFGLGTLIVGLTWQPLVVLGVHNILFFIATTAVQHGESSLFLAAAFAAAWAQMGATIGVMLRNKKMVDKSAAVAAALPGIISGPTESCIYAINLPKGIPFWTGTIAGGIGGWLIGIFNVSLDNLAGLGGIIGFLAYSDDLIEAIIIDLASFSLGILITYLLYKENKTAKSLTLKTTMNFKKKEFLTGQVDYQAQKLIKIIWKNNWNCKPKNQKDLIIEVENLKKDLIQFNQTLESDINHFISNLQKNEHNWFFNKNLIKKLKLIKTARQIELNEIYKELKNNLKNLKIMNFQTKNHAQLSAKKANWDYKLNKIENLKEEKNANLFNKGQKLIQSNNPLKIKKGNLLIEKSKNDIYKTDKSTLIKNKIQECEKIIKTSNINLNQKANQFYVNVEKYINKIETIKNKDLIYFKSLYFNDIHHLEIQEKTISSKIIKN